MCPAKLCFSCRKRKAELSPIKNERVKRSALGNLTNALIATENDDYNNKKGISTVQAITKKPLLNENSLKNVPKIQPISSRTRAAATKTQTKSSSSKHFSKTLIDTAFHPPLQRTQAEKNSKSKENEVSVITTAVKAKQGGEVPLKTTRRISNEFEKTEESLYVSALEDIPSDTSRLSSDVARSNSYDKTLGSTSSSQSLYSLASSTCKEDYKSDAFQNQLPPGVEDFDRANWNDPFQVSHYAYEIFGYLKEREHYYKISDYISKQPELSKWMRSLLIDWMVEVQESFELNHETLYLAVKIVDTYLGKEKVSKDALQLLGAASLLIACKYDVSDSQFTILQYLTILVSTGTIASTS